MTDPTNIVLTDELAPTEGKNIKLDPNRWTFERFVAFQKAFRAGRASEFYDLIEQLIVAWDYTTPTPLGEGAIWDLSMDDAAAVTRTVFDLLNHTAENIPFKEYVVNFGDWNLRKFAEFNKLQAEGKTDEYIPLMLEICTGPDVPEKDNAMSMSYPVGVAINRAIADRYQRMLTGKS